MFQTCSTFEHRVGVQRHVREHPRSAASLAFGSAQLSNMWKRPWAARRSGKRLQDPITVVSYVVENKDTKGRPPTGTDHCIQIVRIPIVVAAAPSSEQCGRMEHVDAKFGG